MLLESLNIPLNRQNLSLLEDLLDGRKIHDAGDFVYLAGRE